MIEFAGTEKTGDGLECRDCGTTSARSWYWVGPNGSKMNRPRCPDCHEQASRHMMRDGLGYGRFADENRDRAFVIESRMSE